MKKEDNYSCGMDILRIIAMLMVLLVHITLYVDFGRITYIFKIGMYGVQLFFVMSGYLIMKSIENSNSTKEFYIKRFNRFIPQYYGILILIIASSELILHNVPSDKWGLGWFRYIFCLERIVPTDEVFWENQYAMWTISAFVLFYLIAPLIYKYVKSFKSSIVLLVLGFGIQIINKYLYGFIIKIMNIDASDYDIGGTALHDLYIFFIGVIVFLQ